MTKAYEWKLPDNWDTLLEQSKAFDEEWAAWKAAGMPKRGDEGAQVPVFKDSYKGWACIHGFDPPEHNHTGKTIEQLIFDINMMGGYVKIAVDQWWGIRTDVQIVNWGDESDPNWIELEFNVYVQADNLHDGLEKTYDVVKSRWEFHKQKKWE